nr:hypothetical protein [Tanacetum cinerariifolium]
MQLIQKLRDDQKCMKKVEPSSRSKTIEDIISIGSFVEALVLNHYVLVRKILSSNIDFIKPFGCPVTILNTLNHLGKFEEKAHKGKEMHDNAGQARQEKASDHEYILLLFMPSSTQSSDDKDADEVPGRGEEGSGIDDQARTNSSTQDVNTAEPSINTANTNINTDSLNINTVGPNDQSMPSLEETGIFNDIYDDREVGAEADTNNLDLSTVVGHIPTTRVHKYHLKEQIIDDLNLATQTRRMLNFSEENAMASYINKQRRTNHKDYQNYLFACFLSQQEPKKVFRNKKDERGILIRNKARLVAQGYTQEEGIDYDKVFAPVARIEAIRLFLAYTSFIGFIVYQMDVKSAFLYGIIEEEVYVCQPPGFEDPHFPNKVEKALYGLHQAPKACYETLSTYLLENEFRRGTIDKTLFIMIDRDDILLLQVKQNDDGIFISQDKYVADILKKFDFSSVKTVSTPIETHKALLKDEEAQDVDVHLYRLMIGSLMYLTTSRPNIMFVVCACARFQVTPKISHLHVMKRIFRYLKGQPKLGLWYLRDSPFDLEAFFDSNYAGASLDRKSTTGESDGFEQIVNFLNANPIKYALTVSPTIYTSCIKQFWTSAKVKTVNDDVQIQALVDTKKVVVNEASIRRDIRLDDAEGTACLPNAAIFGELTRMGIVSSDEEGLGDQEDASKQRRSIADIDQDEGVTLVDDAQGRMNEEDLFGVHDLSRDEVFVDVTVDENVELDATVAKKEISTADSVTTADKLTLAQTLMEIKAAKPKAKGVTIQEPSEFKITSSSQPSQPPQAKDKGKGIMVEPEKPLKMKDQISLNEKVARNLEAEMKAEMEEEERIARKKEEANIAMIAEWDNIQAMMDADCELAVKLQEEERGELTIKEKSKLFVELMNKRKKHFERLRAEERRRKPQTKAQKRKQMCTYLKNMAGFTHNQLKSKSFEEVQQAFNKTMNWVNNFVAMDSEAVKDRAVESSKRVREELKQESAKKQKLDEQVQAIVADDDTAELKRCLKIVPDDDDDVTIEATTISSKSPTIVDYKIYREWKKSYFKIIRADGNSQNYLIF